MAGAGKERKNRKQEKPVSPGEPGTEARPAKKKKHIVRRIVLILLLVIVLGVGGTWGYFSLKQKYTTTYQEYTTTIGTISNALSFSGTLQALHDVTYTASSSATVRDVFVKQEQEVKEGQALLRLSNGRTVSAEFDGKVNQLPVSAGDKVSAGDTLVQVVDFTHMKVSIRVDEYDISDVHTGDMCRVSVTARERAFTSVIDQINYVSSSTGSVAYYTATAYVDVSGEVYPGMQVTVTIPKEEAANVVVLRAEALSFDTNNQAFVYTRNGEGELVTTPVKTGVSNGNYVEITEGLKSGETVYVAVETQQDSFNELLQGIFGTQRFNRQQQPNTNWNRNNTNNQNRNTQNNNQNTNRQTNQSAPGGGGR